MSARKDMEAVVAGARKQGWRVQKTKNGHWKFFAPDGENIVTASGTPTSGRAITHTVTRMRRYGFKWKGR